MRWMIVLLCLTLNFSAWALEIGSAAPDFELLGVADKSQNIKLGQFKGKTVVLEWTNHGCPFVRKHYDSGNMQQLQKLYSAKGVVWLSIISSAPGKQGHSDEKTARSEMLENKSQATFVLLDPTGKVGKTYGAKTTPHIFIIDPKGFLAYQGAIDDTPDTDTKSIATSKNYVALALDEILASKKVSIPSTKAYGCSVKY